MATEMRYRGRVVSASDVEFIQQLIRDNPRADGHFAEVMIMKNGWLVQEFDQREQLDSKPGVFEN